MVLVYKNRNINKHHHLCRGSNRIVRTAMIIIQHVNTGEYPDWGYHRSKVPSPAGKRVSGIMSGFPFLRNCNDLKVTRATHGAFVNYFIVHILASLRPSLKFRYKFTQLSTHSGFPAPFVEI